MTDTKTKDRPSLGLLYGETLYTAFLASLSGPFLSSLLLLLVSPNEEGLLGIIVSLVVMPLIMSLFAFPIGLLALLLVGPLTTWLCFGFVRAMPVAAIMVGAASGFFIGGAICWEIFDGEGYFAPMGAISGGAYGGIWIWLCWRNCSKKTKFGESSHV